MGLPLLERAAADVDAFALMRRARERADSLERTYEFTVNA